MEKKVFDSVVIKADNENLILEHFISTETPDRANDIVLADGMRIKGIPVVLQQHGMAATGDEPIAKPVSLTIGTNNKGVRGIIAKTQYYNGSHLNPPDNTGRRLFEKARDGYMSSWSIGFDIIKYEPRENGGRLIKEWELLEYSQVAIPCNPEATTIKSNDTSEIKYGIVDGKKENDTGEDMTDNNVEKLVPNSGESEEEFMARCIPEMIAEGKPEDQAIAMCYSMYADGKRIESGQSKNIAPAVKVNIASVEAGVREGIRAAITETMQSVFDNIKGKVN